MLRVLIVLLALTTTTALAQQPPLSVLEQALAQKVTEEVNTNVNLRAQLIAAQAKIKELEDAKQKSQTSQNDGGSGSQSKLR